MLCPINPCLFDHAVFMLYISYHNECKRRSQLIIIRYRSQNLLLKKINFTPNHKYFPLLKGRNSAHVALSLNVTYGISLIFNNNFQFFSFPFEPSSRNANHEHKPLSIYILKERERKKENSFNHMNECTSVPFHFPYNIFSCVIIMASSSPFDSQFPFII